MKALILVDLQYDFMPGGALAVSEGDSVVPIANSLLDGYDIVVASQDWHPPGHSSFAEQGGPWPIHCMQGTRGADLHADLDEDKITRIFQKGTDLAVDSYSALYDNDHKTSTGMSEWLKEQGVSEVDVLGLATDYCVKFTALDCVKDGFKTNLILKGCRGVNINLDDSDNAVKDMAEAGISIID